MRHQRPCRHPLTAREGCSGLWARRLRTCQLQLDGAEETSGLRRQNAPESTADDHLTLDGDANVVVGADPEHALGITVRLGIARMLNGGSALWLAGQRGR